jgi:hypothetical protein
MPPTGMSVKKPAGVVIFFCFAFGLVALIQGQQDHSTGLVTFGFGLIVAGVCFAIQLHLAKSTTSKRNTVDESKLLWLPELFTDS